MVSTRIELLNIKLLKSRVPSLVDKRKNVNQLELRTFIKFLWGKLPSLRRLLNLEKQFAHILYNTCSRPCHNCIFDWFSFLTKDFEPKLKTLSVY